MNKEILLSNAAAETTIGSNVDASWKRVVRRRSFLHGIGMTGALALPAGRLFAQNGQKLSKNDAALLRFAAAAEFTEADLWQQYNELGGAVDHNDNPNPGTPHMSPR